MYWKSRWFRSLEQTESSHAGFGASSGKRTCTSSPSQSHGDLISVDQLISTPYFPWRNPLFRHNFEERILTLPWKPLVSGKRQGGSVIDHSGYCSNLLWISDYHRQLNAISLGNGSFYSFSTQFPPLVSEMLGAALFEMDGIHQAQGKAN